MADGRISERMRREVFRRAGGCCEYCLSQARFSPDSFSVEHIVPRSRGGTDEKRNLALSCQGCNNKKYVGVDAPDPVSGSRTPLYHPRSDVWSSHFAWNEDYTLILGTSPVGRATVERLQLNRDSLVNFRRILREAGEHPPLGRDD